MAAGRNEPTMSSSELEQLARASRAIAHDLRNVFSVITACAVDLYDEMHGRQAATLVLEILNAGERGLLAATELLQAGRTEPEVPRPMDLGRQVADLEPILRRLAAPTIALELGSPTGAAWVAIDRTSLLQILMNLVANASDASTQGSAIGVGVGRGRRALDHGGRVDVATMTVTDRGEGMEPGLVARMFDEGFSTKEGAHWGLGLSVVRRVVDRCGGWIDVRSVCGEGTTVEVQFPLAAPEQTGVALVVVHDDLRRLWLADSLAAIGVEVIAVADALEACDLVGGVAVPDIAVLDERAAADRGLRHMARLDQVPSSIVLEAGQPSSVEEGRAIARRCSEATAVLRVSR
jgi:two-component system cell cycle sensor histidine kinase/response regulator CckA